MMNNPTPGCIRAAEQLITDRRHVAELVNRETHASEMLEALRDLVRAEDDAKKGLGPAQKETLERAIENARKAIARECPNDTDGDGNCHICFGKGACLWAANL
jgi:hypothetical protein